MKVIVRHSEYWGFAVVAAVKAPVTQTKKSPIVAKLSDFFAFSENSVWCKNSARFFCVISSGGRGRTLKMGIFTPRKEDKKWRASKKETTVITL